MGQATVRARLFLERWYRIRHALVPMQSIGMHLGGSASEMKRQSRNPRMPDRARAPDEACRTDALVTSL